MLDYIKNDPEGSLFLLIILIAVVVYFLKYKSEILEKAALHAVSIAEAEWESGTGRIKFAEAYLYMKKNHPIITFFMSESKLSDIIEKALLDLKDNILSAKESKNGNTTLKSITITEVPVLKK